MDGRAARHGVRHVAARLARPVALGAVATFAVVLAGIVGGAGAVCFVLATAAAVLAVRRTRGTVVVAVVTALALWSGVSFARYVGSDNGETVTTRAATWARNHGLGGIVDQLEAWAYSDPPSVAPAPALALVGTESRASTSVEPATAPTSTTSPTPATVTSIAAEAATTTVAPSTTVVPSGPPPALTPVFAPPLDGEGVWRAVATAGGHDAMWATGIRPLPGTGGVVATVVAIDQAHLRAGLFNGSELPGGTWLRGNRIPADLRPAAIAAMNGGFRFDHITGGYVTEGRVVKPLHEGDATLAIDRAGKVAVGMYGRDLVDDGTWVSLRQNLRLMVDDGRSMVGDGVRRGVWWGADYGKQVYVPRTGLCELRDGMIAYLLAGPVDAEQFAQVMIAVGCRIGMQLDINGTWPAFDVYAHDGGTITPSRVDSRMSANVYRYLDGSSKEFVAFFDAALVPDPSVLDG